MLFRVVTILACLFSFQAHASLVKTDSFSELDSLAESYPDLGGIVVSFTGRNSLRYTDFLSPETLYKDVFAPNREDEYLIELGSWTPSDDFFKIMGSGFVSMSIRMTIWDGDTAAGEADHNGNYLDLNDIRFDNFSDVETYETSRDGTIYYGDVGGKGFSHDYASTGWFHFDRPSYGNLLDALYKSVQETNSLSFQLYSNAGKRNFISLSDIVPDVPTSGRIITSVNSPNMFAIFAIMLFLLVKRRNI